MTVDEIRAEIAAALEVPTEQIGPRDNIFDHGLDSIQLMNLVRRWSMPGREVSFVDLIDRPTAADWSALLSGVSHG
ncbi:MAG TPA: phosphopantetheine-binding protein [Pseudonocardiaceae bacterium]|nr:phosphopantetheine-binding protein [Pseudonocardiaceae bacterium]